MKANEKDTSLETDNPLETIKAAIKKHAYRFSEIPFRLAAGGTSQHYFNLKRVLMNPHMLVIICDTILGKLSDLYEDNPDLDAKNIDGVGGLTMGGDALIYTLSNSMASIGMTWYPLIVRKKPKEHGTRLPVEGLPSQVSQLLLVDDVCTTGSSTIKALKAIREYDIKVDYAFCIIDREEGATEALAKEKVTLFSLFKKSDFLNPEE